MKLYRYVVLIFTGLILAFVMGACVMSSSTPTSSLQAACAAVKNKDIAAYKKLSKSKLASIYATAKQSNMSTDELLEKYLDVINCAATPETGDEEINDDKATLILKNPSTGDVDKYSFVKEEGVWKLN